jgi:hypothetical protein
VAATIGTDEDTLLGGFHLGYNWQNGQLVYGAEGDYAANGGFDDYLASNSRPSGLGPRSLYCMPLVASLSPARTTIERWE